MPDVLTEIWNDHNHLKLLLDALERQLAVFRQGATPDYEIVGGVIDYCLYYPEKFHHPKEEAMLERLGQRNPEAAAGLKGLSEEHERLSQLTESFADAVNQVLDDRIVSHAWFDDIAIDFLEFYRKHIDWEEAEFLPQCIEKLTPQDWDDIDALFSDYVDPVFGHGEEERFKALRSELLLLEREHFLLDKS
jgi:hemerythrin-like domain-containing protein